MVVPNGYLNGEVNVQRIIKDLKSLRKNTIVHLTNKDNHIEK